jgi:hypothetical protein
MTTTPDQGDEAAAAEPLVIDSGPLLMQATTQPDQQDQEVRNASDRPGPGE